MGTGSDTKGPEAGNLSKSSQQDQLASSSASSVGQYTKSKESKNSVFSNHTNGNAKPISRAGSKNLN